MGWNVVGTSEGLVNKK